jgi:hypothetical protein
VLSYVVFGFCVCVCVCLGVPDIRMPIMISEPKPEFPGPYDPERARYLYKKACQYLDIVPSGLFLRCLKSGRVTANNQGMGPVGAHAVALSLIVSR